MSSFQLHSMDPSGLASVALLGLSWTVRATVVLALAWGAAWIVRNSSAAARHLVWLTSLLAVSILPFATLTLPWRWEVAPITTLSPSSSLTSEPATTGATDSGPTVPVVDGSRDVPSRAAPSPAAASGGAASGIAASEAAEPGADRARARTEVVGLMLLWSLGTILALGFLVRGRLQLARARRAGLEPRGPEWEDRLGRLAAAVGVDEDVAILESPGISVPLTVGVFRKEILLPAGATSRWPADRLDAVLLHELGHVRRRDVLGHLLGRVLCAIHWFNPLVWLASRRMARECERACDDLVLGTGARPSDYAEHLLEIVRSERERRLFTPALSMARKGDFEGRILALLDPDAPREPVHRGAALGAVVVVAALTLLVSVPSATGTGTDGETPSSELSGEVDEASPEPLSQRPPSPDGASPATVSPNGRSTDAVHASIQTALSGAEAVETTLSETLVELLADPHPRVRAAAARSLGDRRSEAAIPELVRALEDPDEEVREEAAVALGQIGTHSAVDALARVLLEDEDDEVRESAAWALGETEGPDAVAHLADALDRIRDDRVRADIVEALGETRQPAAVDVLATFLTEADGRLRSRALEALVEIDSEPAMNVVIEAMRSDDPFLRRAAAAALSGG